MFDFLQIRVAVGVVIGKRCDNPEEYVTSFRVSTSYDGAPWSYIDADDVQAQCDDLIFTWWFGREVAARCWRIEPVTCNNFAAMQAEILGYA